MEPYGFPVCSFLEGSSFTEICIPNCLVPQQPVSLLKFDSVPKPNQKDPDCLITHCSICPALTTMKVQLSKPEGLLPVSQKKLLLL